MDGQSTRIGATLHAAERANAVAFDDLPDDVRTIALQCILDHFAVTLGGATAGPVGILTETARDQGGVGTGSARILGSGEAAAPFWAAWINGAASHVNVYDDVNMSIPGHGSATTIPAILALAAQTGCDGRRAIEAFVAGYETTCAIAIGMGPSHYDMGWHSSATLGCYGATAAAGRLLDLDPGQMAEGFGAASTMAAGFKSVFGSGAKCVQVGRAPAAGVLAANMARRGMTSNGHVLEHPQGVAAAQTRDGPGELILAEPASGYALRDNLFKYFAACYMAAAPIECALDLRRRLGPDAARAGSVVVTVNPAVSKVCNIDRPATALEAKYSVRAVVSMALNDISPSDLANFESVTRDYDRVSGTAGNVRLAFDDRLTDTQCEIRAEGPEGVTEVSFDAGRADTDLDRQQKKLDAKFRSFVTDILGAERTEELREAIMTLPEAGSLDRVMQLATRPT